MINTIVTEIALPLLLSLLAIVSAQIMLWLQKYKAKIKQETAKLQDERKRLAFAAATDYLDGLVSRTVASLEQTVAKGLREAVKDGRTNREELLALSKRAYNMVVENLTEDTYTSLRQNIPELCNYIENMIEEKILLLKADTEIFGALTIEQP